MINGQSVLAVIPARGGSKGIYRKNIRPLAGKPLIAWTIEEAKKSKYIDRLILSSEDEEIIEIAGQYGCDVPFIRPKELARDDTPGIETVLHALKELPGYDLVVLLQPTSPLRKAIDIDNTIQKYFEAEASTCVTVSEVKKNPYWMYSINKKCRLEPIIKDEKVYTCRQNLPAVYALNGGVYIAKTDWLMERKILVCEDTVACIMPRNRSIDIDDEIDLAAAEALITRQQEL